MEYQLAEAAGTAQLPHLPAQHRRAPHPSTMQMVIEALQATDSKKGASAAAIKKFILDKYPTVEPARLKHWLKVALSKGLSSGDLVRPHNSTATGATGTFMLAPKMLKQKQPPGQEDPDRGEPPKPAQAGASQRGRAPMAGVQQQGAMEGKLTAVKKSRMKPTETAVKKKSRMKPTEASPPAAAKPRSDGVKSPRVVGHHRGPGKGRPGSSMAPGAGGDSSESSEGAGAKRPRKTPAGKSKRKVPKESQSGASEGAQPEVFNVKGAEGKVRKPRGKAGASQGQVSLKKAAATLEGKKAS